jgi:hypothetical protein
MLNSKQSFKGTELCNVASVHEDVSSFLSKWTGLLHSWHNKKYDRSIVMYSDAHISLDIGRSDCLPLQHTLCDSIAKRKK